MSDNPAARVSGLKVYDRGRHLLWWEPTHPGIDYFPKPPQTEAEAWQAIADYTSAPGIEGPYPCCRCCDTDEDHGADRPGHTLPCIFGCNDGEVSQ